MRSHQPASRFEIVVLAELAREANLLIGGQQRHPVDRLDVGIDASDAARMQAQGHAEFAGISAVTAALRARVFVTQSTPFK